MKYRTALSGAVAVEGKGRHVPMVVSTLTLGNFDALPSHDRRCIFWTLDPDAGDLPDSIGDPEFEKEAWLSMVMLEWGPCGQVAVDDERTLGCSLYAPPGAVPRSRSFPTAPVSPDAILLTSLRPSHQTEDIRAELLAATVQDLINRGVRALEAFGYRPTGDDDGADSTPDVAGGDGCTAKTCMVDAQFLVDSGFTVVADHPRFPRLRLELDRDHGWKEDVEAALDRLLAEAELTVVIADPRVPVGVR